MNDQIVQPTIGLLDQLKKLLESLTDEQYGRKVALLSDASIGQHTRHVIEFFQELEKGYETGRVNYDARKRNYTLETQRKVAINELEGIAAVVTKENRALNLVADFSGEDSNFYEVPTNYQRELVYNLEHTIHHMALLKIGVGVVSTIELPENFGVAISTLKYRAVCVQ
jgi:hypothetical protein